MTPMGVAAPVEAGPAAESGPSVSAFNRAPASNVVVLPAPDRPASWWHPARPRHPWLWLVAFIIASGWDRALWLHISKHTLATADRLESWTFGQFVSSLYSWNGADIAEALRYVGYHSIKLCGTVWVPALLAAAMVLRPFFQHDTARVTRGLRRGTLLFLCPAAAGLLAEFLKLIFKRQRPEFADGHYLFRLGDWLTDPLNGSGLGLPSSHAAVAVGSAVVLSVVYPHYRVGWVVLAVACGLSRIFAGAHFTSDVVLGAFVGLIAARAVLALDLRNNQGVPVPA